MTQQLLNILNPYTNVSPDSTLLNNKGYSDSNIGDDFSNILDNAHKNTKTLNADSAKNISFNTIHSKRENISAERKNNEISITDSKKEIQNKNEITTNEKTTETTKTDTDKNTIENSVDKDTSKNSSQKDDKKGESETNLVVEVEDTTEATTDSDLTEETNLEAKIEINESEIDITNPSEDLVSTTDDSQENLVVQEDVQNDDIMLKAAIDNVLSAEVTNSLEVSAAIKATDTETQDIEATETLNSETTNNETTVSNINTKTSTDIATTEEIADTQLMDNKIVDTKDKKDATHEIKVQPQSEQARVNITSNNEIENTVSTETTTSETTKTNDINTTAIDVDVETQVSTQNVDAVDEVVAKTDITTEKNTKAKEALAKAGLDEKSLDSLNIKITNVETQTQSDGGNLLNHQSASEQAVRLSIQNISDVKGANSISATTFAKTLSQATSNNNPTDISKADIMSQIHSKIEALRTADSSKLTIMLKPDNLGKINIELIQNKDGIMARLTADSIQVKDMLDKNLDGLKNTLTSQGINVNSVNVRVEDTAKADGQAFTSDEQGDNLAQEFTRQGFSGNTSEHENKSTNDFEFFSNLMKDTDSETANNDIDYKV